MDLYIVRHAWAGHYGDPQWPDDDLRPLTKEGGERFTQVAAKLASRGMTPQLVGTSPLVRCVQTARILASDTGQVNVVELDQLRPGGDAEGLLRWTVRQARTYQRIAWVGHAPDVNRLAAALIGDEAGLIRFSKGGVAAIRFDGSPDFGGGELRWLVTAKVLGC